MNIVTASEIAVMLTDAVVLSLAIQRVVYKRIGALTNHNLFYSIIIMNKLLAEFLGTLLFLYVILATGSAVPIGIALMVSIMIFGSFSGGNFNPAVTVMMVAKGAQPASDLLPYIVAQVAGGLAALELYKRVKI